MQNKALSHEEIKSIRIALKLTQEAFAARLKVDVVTVSRWERGERRPTPASRHKLNRIYRKVTLKRDNENEETQH